MRKRRRTRPPEGSSVSHERAYSTLCRVRMRAHGHEQQFGDRIVVDFRLNSIRTRYKDRQTACGKRKRRAGRLAWLDGRAGVRRTACCDGTPLAVAVRRGIGRRLPRRGERGMRKPCSSCSFRFAGRSQAAHFPSHQAIASAFVRRRTVVPEGDPRAATRAGGNESLDPTASAMAKQQTPRFARHPGSHSLTTRERA